jgi:hypothetical protein
MHRPQFVGMRQHGAKSGGLGFEALIAQERIEPDQPLAGAMQAVHFAGERVARLALESVGDQQDICTLADNVQSLSHFQD